MQSTRGAVTAPQPAWRTDKRPPEQRALARCHAMPPPVPDVAAAADDSSKRQRREVLLMQAQDELHRTSVWARELLAPASTSSPPSSSTMLRDRMRSWRTKAEEGIAAQNAARRAAMQQMQEAAAELAADLARARRAPKFPTRRRLCRVPARAACSPLTLHHVHVRATGLKRAGTSGSEMELLAAKRAREAAHPTTRFVPASPALVPARTSGAVREPSGLVAL